MANTTLLKAQGTVTGNTTLRTVFGARKVLGTQAWSTRGPGWARVAILQVARA